MKLKSYLIILLALPVLMCIKNINAENENKQETLKRLIAYVPNTTKSLMIFNIKKSTIEFVKIYKLTQFLPISQTGTNLLNSIASLPTAISMIEKTRDSSAISVCTIENDSTMTIFFYKLIDTQKLKQKAAKKLLDFPYITRDISWQTLVIDKNCYAMVGQDNAMSLAKNIKENKTGNPHALLDKHSKIDNSFVAEVHVVNEENDQYPEIQHVKILVTKEKTTYHLKFIFICKNGAAEKISQDIKSPELTGITNKELINVINSASVLVSGNSVQVSYDINSITLMKMGM